MSDLNFAGQLQIDAIDWIQPNGIALDIREHFQQITIYEDMFAPFMTGNIVMRDTIDIPNLYLRTGIDLLRIRVLTPGIEDKYVIDKYFHLYKMDDRTEVSDRTLTYILHFISAENIQDQANKIARTFKGSAEDIAEIIRTQYLQSDIKMNVDKTSNIIQYTSNYWIPTKNLMYIAERAIGSGNLPSYLFYENRDGLNLKEMTSFADKDVPLMQSWSANDYMADVNDDGQVIRDPMKDYQAVKDFSIDVGFDYMKDASSGLIKTRLVSYDFITRQYFDRTANILDNELPILNEQRMYNDGVIAASGAKLVTGFSSFDLYDGSGYNSSAVNSIHKRNVIMRAYTQHKVELTVIGRTDYTVGKKVWFDSNKVRPFDKTSSVNEIYDNTVSGYWITSAVRHIFGRDNYHDCKVELIRDSIQKAT